MKTLLGISTKYRNHSTINYLRSQGRDLFIAYSGTKELHQIPKDATVLAEQWGIFPSELSELLRENNASHKITPSTDAEFLETADISVIYVAGERALKKLSLQGPAISWQHIIKELPDSRLKNLVWLAAEKWLNFMSIKPTSFEAIE